MKLTLHPDTLNIAVADAVSDDANAFSTEKQLGKLTGDWPMARLVELWNSFAGTVPFDDLKPVKKFTDRASAMARIWKAVQRLGKTAPVEIPHVDAQPAPTPNVAPVAEGGATTAPPAKKAATARTAANVGHLSKRDDSKKATIIALLRREGGASLSELMTATGWMSHSIRGFVSGTICKKLQMNVESFKNAAGRAYRIVEVQK